MNISIAGIIAAVACLPFVCIVAYLQFYIIGKLKKKVKQAEDATLHLMDHVLATTVPLQLAKEINTVALSEAVATANVDKEIKEAEKAPKQKAKEK